MSHARMKADGLRAQSWSMAACVTLLMCSGPGLRSSSLCARRVAPVIPKNIWATWLWPWRTMRRRAVVAALRLCGARRVARVRDLDLRASASVLRAAAVSAVECRRDLCGRHEDISLVCCAPLPPLPPLPPSPLPSLEIKQDRFVTAAQRPGSGRAERRGLAVCTSIHVTCVNSTCKERAPLIASLQEATAALAKSRPRQEAKPFRFLLQLFSQFSRLENQIKHA